MIIDKLLSPAIKLPLAGLVVGTTTVGTVMDFGAPRNQGLFATAFRPGWDINVRGATAGAAATLSLILVTDDNAALTSPTTLLTIGVQALAALVKFDEVAVLPNTNLWERYVAWRVIVGGFVFTGGTLSIEYAANIRNYRAYPAQGNQ